jgi:hypothetical protein
MDSEMISWLVGERSVPYAVKFIDDLASRLANRVQLTTDGHRPYLQAVEGPFGSEIDNAVLEKIYAASAGMNRSPPRSCAGGTSVPRERGDEPVPLAS